ncbi:hypothetical protein SAMN04488005_3009 [Yoonia tamlensis]|uniref:Uncharacterized protein n=1 Tax=Yoonia tamlensis TaxID=390270 RepID=A0A1I6HUY1_9RHOB|nr:hypothetical protein [Yoonia tamlensis]SFR58251.1 hypothetical protein SAMN04488005_3009 [Yoonia tamlensis]
MKHVFVLAKFAVIGALLFVVGRLVLMQNDAQAKILVVHSYNTDLAWVNDVDDGIRRAAGTAQQSGGPHLNLRTHYMNLRNHPDCNFYKNAAAEVRFTLDDWKPEVIILVDDLAQALVGFNQLALHENADRYALAQRLNDWISGGRCATPALDFFGLDRPADGPLPAVVFAGVNGGTALYGYEQASNVSGIFERKNYDALIETLVSLERAYAGDVAGIMMLNDASPTAITESENYLAQDWGPFTAAAPVNAANLAQWEAAVATANARDLMLLIANYQNVLDTNGLPVPAEDLVAWTELHAKLPVLGVNTRFVADGGMMTVAIAGSEQGEVAMELALAVLNGVDTDPLREAKQFLIGLNQSLVRKRGLALPAIYEAFSREIGSFIPVVDDLYVVQGVQDG